MSEYYKKYLNVKDSKLKRKPCSGCGVCAALCPHQSLEMEWNNKGEYEPILKKKCFNCGMCLKVCPFFKEKEREFVHKKKYKYNKITGYYLNLFSGFSKINDNRYQGSGGGLTRWLLEKLFSEKIVDRVCCVTSGDNSDTMFKYSILNNVHDIRKSSRSCYYPVEISKIISDILKDKKKYVVVGLPCVLRALRLAMKNNQKLKNRIIVLVGLVCGQQKNKFFAEYLCSLSNGDPLKIKSASFRVKDEKRHHVDHRFEYIYEKKKRVQRGFIYQSEGMAWIWGNDCFKLKACNFCDDITSEVADVSFGDAIDAKYSYGNLGANFVIVRSERILNVLLKGKHNNEIELNNAPLKAVLKRQKGVILIKRKDLSHRLYEIFQRENINYFIPRFKIKKRFNFYFNFYMKLRDQMNIISTDIYSKYRNKSNVIEKVQDSLKITRSTFFEKNKLYFFLNKIIYVKKRCYSILKRKK